jgi:hypothetical protein
MPQSSLTRRSPARWTADRPVGIGILSGVAVASCAELLNGGPAIDF